MKIETRKKKTYRNPNEQTNKNPLKIRVEMFKIWPNGKYKQEEKRMTIFLFFNCTIVRLNLKISSD